MPTCRAQLAAFAILASVLGGCGVLIHADTKLVYTRGLSAPPLKKVYEAGAYGLYSGDDDSLVTAFDLKAGDQYGFKRRGDDSIVGDVIASGEEKEFDLPARYAGSYYWRLKSAESGK